MDWEKFTSEDYVRLNAQFACPRLTETEWQTATHLFGMASGLPDSASRRKLRLLACAAVRTVWDFVTDDRARKALLAAELFADGNLTPEDLERTYRSAFEWVCALSAGMGSFNQNDLDRNPDLQVRFREITACFSATEAAAPEPPAELTIDSAAGLNESYWNAHLQVLGGAHNQVDIDRHVAVYRDLFGNPYRPVAFDQECQTPEIQSLANRIYTEWAFDRMPELAVLLEEAGCREPAVLEHCRNQGEHFRGCWVIDLLTGRS